ncbi:hypothetical protein CRM22_004387 [Opisthorchis felineus]|uniref:Uncharacterized protein n=1 Tax=Opisthorchis felineus TaxID=147828 RepID=A0A4S2LWF8_OPIFE|nr:hypothetical protein CRM22_004387 [Opisthorchis felineus]
MMEFVLVETTVEIREHILYWPQYSIRPFCPGTSVKRILSPATVRFAQPLDHHSKLPALFGLFQPLRHSTSNTEIHTFDCHCNTMIPIEYVHLDTTNRTGLSSFHTIHGSQV